MRFECKKCKRLFNRKSNLELHEKNCDGIVKEVKKKKVIDNLSIKDEKENVKIKECKESKTGIHDLIVLRPINIIQKRAIENGYTAYCRICRELI
ncbi:MAG: hypothetical protein ABSD50_15975 [Smithella sp.]|jgi:hypothetical protein